jgi:hypothetical protein
LARIPLNESINEDNIVTFVQEFKKGRKNLPQNLSEVINKLEVGQFHEYAHSNWSSYGF